ncbi:hypothetical protein [Janthinobacterium sp. CG_S6]|uniref:hypothetical protein n=1 Tax=Janthinobacterium sp. CG_S6 TaxID=3071707 RepID=UPI002DFD9B3F|nr:Sec-independent protein translocase protein TatA [Janthinobacterium sp. CG_S6]
MRIPTGNFGNVTAQPQAQAQVPGGNGIGQAVGNLGQAIGQVASQAASEIAASAEKLKQAELQQQRAQAGATLATLQNDLHDVHDEIGRSVTDGKMPAAQAIPEFKKRMGEAVGARTKGLTVEQQQLINDHVIKAGGTLERNLNGIAIERTRADTGANLAAMGEQFQRAAMRDLPGAISQWDSSVDAMGPAAGWDAGKIAAAKQSFKEGATYNFANATLEGAAQTGKLDLVRAAREKLEGPEGEPLDPARRTALITTAYGYENGIVASGVREAEKAKSEQQARENKGRDAFKDAQNLTLNGRYMSQDYIAELATVTAGTSAAPAVRELVKSLAAVAGFASLSLSQQAAIIEQRRAAGSTPGVGVSPDQEKITDYMDRIHIGSKKAYDENPWTAAQERGAIPRAQEVQLNDIQGAQAVLAERMTQIGVVEDRAKRKVSPLQPQEAEQIGRLVQALPPDQQSAALASFGKMIGDGDRVAALARQIDTKDKILGTAMMVGDLQTSQGRYVSELVIKGARAIKDKSILMDEHKETGWRGAIAKEIGDAFQSQELRDKMIDAAYYVQAGFAAEGGSADIRRAIRLVVGPIVEHNGSKIPLPRGMEESVFNRRLSSIKPADLVAQTPGGSVFVGKNAVPLEQFVNSLPDAVLVHAGAGRYNVRAGMGLVTNAQGKRITVEVR